MFTKKGFGASDSFYSRNCTTVLSTFTEIANQKIPKNTDGISLKDVFLKNQYLENERTMYWNFMNKEDKRLFYR